MSGVRSFDENTTESDNLLADDLFDCSNISNDEKRLIQNVCRKKGDFENIVTALRKQTFTSKGASRPHFRAK